MGKGARRILIAGAALTALLPASASAVTTIGSSFPPAPAGATLGFNGASSSVTTFNSVLPAAATAPGGLTAPSYGVITRFRIETVHTQPGIFATNPVQLRTINDQGSNHFQMAGHEAGTHPVADVSGIQQFDTRLPIQAGYLLAIDAIAPSGSSHFSAGGAYVNATARTISPALNDGTGTSGSAHADQRALLQADVEQSPPVFNYP